MKQFDYTITFPIGIHVRPAAQLVACAEKFKCRITITKGDTTVSCKTLIGTIALSVKCGDTITMTFDGEDEAAAYDKLLEHFQTNL